MTAEDMPNAFQLNVGNIFRFFAEGLSDEKRTGIRIHCGTNGNLRTDLRVDCIRTEGGNRMKAEAIRYNDRHTSADKNRMKRSAPSDDTLYQESTHSFGCIFLTSISMRCGGIRNDVIWLREKKNVS